MGGWTQWRTSLCQYSTSSRTGVTSSHIPMQTLQGEQGALPSTLLLKVWCFGQQHGVNHPGLLLEIVTLAPSIPLNQNLHFSNIHKWLCVHQNFRSTELGSEHTSWGSLGSIVCLSPLPSITLVAINSPWVMLHSTTFTHCLEGNRWLKLKKVSLRKLGVRSSYRQPYL